MKTRTLITICFMLFGVIALQAQKTIFDFEDTNGKLGLKDASGKVIVNGKYDYIEFDMGSKEPYYRVNIGGFENDDYYIEGGKWGAVDKVTGKEVIPVKYVHMGIFSEGLTYVCLDEKCGFVDLAGKEVIPLKYDYMDERGFSEGLVYVKLNDKYGFIDKTGKEVIPLKYQNVLRFSEGLSGVRLNNKIGFVDLAGKEVIPFKYDDIDYRGFQEGLVAVKLNDKWGFVDKTGKEVIPFNYEYAGAFFNGKTEVKQNGRKFYIDKTGKEVK